MSVTRIFRIEHEGSARYAVEAGGGFRVIPGDFAEGELDSLKAHATTAAIPGQVVTAPRVLVPVAPSKIVAIGLNYKDHAAEMGKPLPAEPLMFLKPSTAVIGPGDAIRIPDNAGRVDHEAELGIVIGKRASRVPAASALDYVLGFTCVNDVTARELQRRDVQYTRGKGFDTFAPLGPCIAIGLDASALDIEGLVNGETRQSSNTRQLIFSVPEIVAFVSGVMTLLPGDVIATGTPSGVGPLTAGDRVTVKIEGIGELSNRVTN